MEAITVELARWGTTASAASIRGHSVTVDRPLSKGGHDDGPMGGELFLVALGGCFMSTLTAVAAARSVNLGQVSCVVTGTLAESPARFSHLTMEVRDDTCDLVTLQRLVIIAERGCIVANTLRRQADVPITVRVEHCGARP